MKERESRKFEAQMEDENGKQAVWITVNLLGIEKQVAEAIICEAESAKERIKKILAS